MITERMISRRHTLISIIFSIVILLSVTGCSHTGEKNISKTASYVSTELCVPNSTEGNLFSYNSTNDVPQNTLQTASSTSIKQENNTNSISLPQPTTDIMSNTYPEKTASINPLDPLSPVIANVDTHIKKSNGNLAPTSTPISAMSSIMSSSMYVLKPDWVVGYPRITYKEVKGNLSPIYTYHFNINIPSKLYLVVMNIDSDISPKIIKEIALTGTSSILRSHDIVFDHEVFTTKGNEEIVKSVQIGINEEINIYTAIESHEGVLVLGSLRTFED